MTVTEVESLEIRYVTGPHRGTGSSLEIERIQYVSED